MLKNALIYSLSFLGGLGTIPVQDGEPIAATFYDVSLSALIGRVDDLEDRVDALDARCQCGLEAPATTVQSVPAGQVVAGVAQSDYDQAVASLRPGETLTAINGIPVPPVSYGGVTGYAAPVAKPTYRPAQTYQAPVRQVAQPRRVFRGVFGGRARTCGPNGCY